MQQQDDLYLEIQSKDFYFDAAVPADYEVVLPNGTVVSLYSRPKTEVREKALHYQGKQNGGRRKGHGDDSDACVCDDPATSGEWLTLSQVAQVLGTTYSAIHRQVKSGYLDAKNINGCLHVSVDELERFKPVYQTKRRSAPQWFEGSIKCATKM